MTTARVLIVDDDPGTCETLADVLEKQNYEVQIARRAQHGLELLETGAPDCTILDINLPDMSGLELLRVIKASCPETEVIFITGYASLPNVIEAIEGAAFAYVKKPFEMKDLLSLLERAVERRRTARALRETNQTLEALVAAAPMAIWAVDPDEIVQMWNPAAERIFGWRREEVLGSRLPTVPLDKVDEARRYRELGLNGKALVDVETQRQRRDAALVEVSLSTAPLRDPSGSIRCVATIVTDITERKHGEKALRESEANFRLLFADNPLPMWLCDLVTLGFTEVNEAAVAWYGYTRDEFLKMRVTDIRPADAAPQLFEFISAKPVSGRREVGESRHRLKDGRVIDVLVRFHVMPIGGRATALVVVEDISDRKRAEAALRESNQALESVIQSSPAAVVVLDLAGKVTRWNRSAERMFGWTEAETLGRLMPNVPAGEEAEWSKASARWREGETAVDLEVPLNTKGGSTVEVSLSVAPLKDTAGRIVGTIGNLVDITERKLLEEHLRQSQKLEAIGSLAGGIAHDFNNLLTVIAGRSYMAGLTLAADDPIRHELELIDQTAERAAGLTRQLLAFSRKQVLEPRVLDLGEVVRGTQRMLERLIGENIALTTESEPGLWLVKADPSQIEQVILNMVVNSRDAMPEGGRVLIQTRNVVVDEAYVRTHAEVRSGPHVALSIKDSGPGMDAATQAQIFEPFFTTKGPGQGTGMGLATVYGIVKQSGGHIAVDSAPGRGTTFTVFLPRVEEALQAPTAAPATATTGTETVLLVEDDDGVRALARETLDRSGYSVLAAVDAKEALGIAQRHAGQIDLVLTDVVMPGMNGRALSDRLLEIRPELKVLFMSGYPANAIAHHGVLDPRTSLLQKPFTPGSLARKVRETLDGGVPSPAAPGA